MKAFRIWLGRLFWFLYLVLVLANPASDILRSADPLGGRTQHEVELNGAGHVLFSFLFAFEKARS